LQPFRHYVKTNGNDTINLTLTPTVVRQTNHHSNISRRNDEYATVNRSSSEQVKSATTSQRKLSQTEIEQMRRMEEARQKVLEKQQNKDQSSNQVFKIDNNTLKTQTQTLTTGVITVAGQPLLRESNENLRVEISENNGNVTRSEFKENSKSYITQSNSQSKNTSSNSFKNGNQVGSNSNRVGFSATLDRHASSRTHKESEEEKFHSLPRNIKTSENKFSNQILHNQESQAERLTRENLEKLQQQSHNYEKVTETKQSQRSYRDTKLHENMLRRNKKLASASKDNSRMSLMSNDSLGGFSQVTFATVSDDNNQKYEDYATQFDAPKDQQFHGFTSTSKTYTTETQLIDERELLKHARNMPKGHSKFNCEKCRELNLQRNGGQPLTFCWERYFPISETTPQPSMQSLLMN